MEMATAFKIVFFLPSLHESVNAKRWISFTRGQSWPEIVQCHKIVAIERVESLVARYCALILLWIALCHERERRFEILADRVVSSCRARRKKKIAIFVRKFWIRLEQKRRVQTRDIPLIAGERE